ncbi:MAG: GntR family transcriptional regulator [Acidobacteriota bacterium]
MLRIDPSNPVPLWKQIQDGVLRLIASGVLRPGDAVDSVRDAARSLGVNPLTVSKAYRGLADQGVLKVRRGEGTFVADAPPPLDHEASRRELVDAARVYVGRARSLGAERAETLEAVDEVWPHPDDSKIRSEGGPTS